MRKMISFKIENLPDKQRKIVDDWANGQANIQQSLANIVMHIVKFTGNDDVMDFDVQGKLHRVFGNGEIGEIVNQQLRHEQVEQQPIQTTRVSPVKLDNVRKMSQWFDQD